MAFIFLMSERSMSGTDVVVHAVAELTLHRTAITS